MKANKERFYGMIITFLSSTAIAPKAAGVRVILAEIERNIADRHSADWLILCIGKL